MIRKNWFRSHYSILVLLSAILLAGAQAAKADCGDWGYSEIDFNRDCYVNLADFAIFCDNWLICSNPTDSDCIKVNKAIIVAHRGYSAIAPENTLSAFNAARGYADMVELDAYSSADGVLVVMHDPNLARTTDGEGYIYNMTLAQLKLLDAGSWFSTAFTGERIPTLEESINAIMPDMTPCIERKGGTAQQYVDLLTSMGVRDKVVVISFTESFLNGVHAIAPEIKLGLLGSSASAVTDSFLVRLAVNGIDIVDWSYGGIADANVMKTHAVGLEVGVWTADTAAAIQAQINRGADYITTNYPELARQLVEQY